MYTRATTLGILAAIAVALPMPSAPTFTLESTGAVNLRAAGQEARYGVVPQAVRGGPILMVSLGEASERGLVWIVLRMMVGKVAPEHWAEFVVAIRDTVASEWAASRAVVGNGVPSSRATDWRTASSMGVVTAGLSWRSRWWTPCPRVPR